jgi:hypothetical protein
MLRLAYTFPERPPAAAVGREQAPGLAERVPHRDLQQLLGDQCMHPLHLSWDSERYGAQRVRGVQADEAPATRTTSAPSDSAAR